VLKRLVKRHGRLPSRIMIRERIEVSDEILAYGGFGYVRRGTYHDNLVAVKTAKVASRANLRRIRKVNINVNHPGRGLN